MFPVIQQFKDNLKKNQNQNENNILTNKKSSSQEEQQQNQNQLNSENNQEKISNNALDENGSNNNKKNQQSYPNFIQNYIQWIMEKNDDGNLDPQELNSNDKKKEFSALHLDQNKPLNEKSQQIPPQNKIEKIKSDQQDENLIKSDKNSYKSHQNHKQHKKHLPTEIKAEKLDIMGREKDKTNSPLCENNQMQQVSSSDSQQEENPVQINIRPPQKTESFPNYINQVAKNIPDQQQQDQNILQIIKKQQSATDSDLEDELEDLDMQQISHSISGIPDSPKRQPSMQTKNLDILLRSDRVKQLKEYIHQNSNQDEICYDKINIVLAKGAKQGQLYIQQEEHKYATQLLCEAIKIRDQKYMHFKNHYHCISEKFIKYDRKGIPYLDWSVNVKLEPKIKNIVNDKKVKSLCYERLKLQEKHFEMHELLNYDKEMKEQKEIMYQDFFTIPKVDTHIHHSACMSAKQLADFLIEIFSDQEQLKRVVKIEQNEEFTLQDVLNQIGVDDPREINVDSLNVQADRTLFKRFDNFNNKYNPQSSSLLREIFLKTDNHMGGEYLALITKRQMEVLAQQNTYTEWRLSVYGKTQDEWSKLGKWIFSYGLNKCKGSEKVSWMIQIPRLYHIYKKKKIVENFGDMINNIFKPLFEVTMDPESDPDLYRFLLMVGGFDSVDDESIFEQLQKKELNIDPQHYTELHNPHYIYWMYYMYANILSLNYLRKIRGLNTFSYRPHCGESGDQSHLISAFLLADGINHGITLQEHISLKYLYYLEQIGLAMSPMSNNKLFLKYRDSPFKRFFQAGFNVSLSTDDPLILHLTSEPLVEEYAIASQIWNLSSVDICEIARNSVVQSSLPEPIKQFWAGQYRTFSSKANNYQHSNLPQSRYMYRLETKALEFQFLGKFLEESDDSSEENLSKK
ncbi:hypothetical protein PPERSA_03699 [Pseudocohnilembus persalinus]|uniref:AMP deaminase n=1 Tax=Pseudocohnilembus persalinus TaxID=266149 RepID=A0A0V0QG62_PSEPJ|nr:hypothetical protein PPERSA_03699 [Pseudocohnilembus persalinus]|eukprot:KRX01195.1 hypothetical protein PPERSA_03699 [Pseudocohnilembus persalinus]